LLTRQELRHQRLHPLFDHVERRHDDELALLLARADMLQPLLEAIDLRQ
jgi:hypothetical protein